ncbi:MAG: SbcC/MukB-like Walker B domain-containing protein, partial [Bacillus sp. (in: firmicutes)]
KDKEQILQKLFHTQIYKKIEEKLKENATVLKRSEEQVQLETQSLMADIVWQTKEEEDLEEQSQHPESVLDALNRDIENRKQALLELQKQLQAMVEQDKVLQNELFQAEQLLAKFDERDKLKREKAKLDEQKEAIVACKDQVELAQKANLLDKQEQSYLRIGIRVNETKGTVDSLRKQVADSVSKLALLREAYNEELSKTKEREEATTKVISLQEMRNDVLSFESFSKEVKQAELKSKESQQKRMDLEKKQELEEQKLTRLQIDLASAQKAAVLFSDRIREQEKNEAARTLLADYQAALQKQAELEAEFNKEKQALLLAEQLVGQEKERLDQLEKSMLHFHASLLAAELEEGQPCAVCGSTVHPKLASQAEDGASQEEFKQQKEKVATAEKQKDLVKQKHYQLQVQFEHLNTDIEKQRQMLVAMIVNFSNEILNSEVEKADEKSKQLKAQISELAIQKEQLPLLEKQIDLSKLASAQLSLEYKEAKIIENDWREQYIQLHAKLENMQARLPEQLRTEQAFEMALKQAVTERDRLQQLLEMKQNSLHSAEQEDAKVKSALETNEKTLQSLEAELNEERALFKAEMEKQGFSQYNLYVAAKKTESEVQNLKTQIEQYETEYQRVQHVLANLEFTLKDLKAPDINMLKEQIAQLAAALQKLRDEQSEQTHLVKQNENISGKLGEMIVKQRDIQEKYEQIGHLYEMSKGQNRFRITFERFVLAAFLDDILLEANERLRKMTSGRYELLRKIDPTRKNVQSGLELTVFDQYTGMERHVKTLSGGESFKASLALALGLAAVVQNNAGGISLETMFIDEGFGTLDPESLDQAIEALLEIQSSGRLVGIISHVPELKERIDANLEVIATQTGSTTKFHLN